MGSRLLQPGCAFFDCVVLNAEATSQVSAEGCLSVVSPANQVPHRYRISITDTSEVLPAEQGFDGLGLLPTAQAASLRGRVHEFEDSLGRDPSPSLFRGHLATALSGAGFALHSWQWKSDE